MMTESALRFFNTEGLLKFRHELDSLSTDPRHPIDFDWIHEDEFSDRVSPGIQLEDRKLSTKLEAADFLAPVLQGIELRDKYYHQGLWSWLSAYLLDSVCPAKNGQRSSPGRSYRHIPPANRNWRTVYRHLLAGPIRIYELHDYKSKILLNASIDVLGDFMEQLASRQEIAGSEGILQAADYLYWDDQNDAPKVGARATNRAPGTLRRYIDVLQQLMLTYDLYSLDGEEILTLLPLNEFRRWMPEELARTVGS